MTWESILPSNLGKEVFWGLYFLINSKADIDRGGGLSC